MKFEEYQGWTNAQTWCVAGMFNNTKVTQDKALSIVRDNLDNPKIAEKFLLELAKNNVSEIYAFAEWAWADCESLTYDVNWEEIREHYVLEIEEDRRYEVAR